MVSIYLSIYLPFCLSIHPSISVCLSVSLSLSFYPSIHLHPNSLPFGPAGWSASWEKEQPNHKRLNSKTPRMLSEWVCPKNGDCWFAFYEIYEGNDDKPLILGFIWISPTIKWFNRQHFERFQATSLSWLHQQAECELTDILSPWPTGWATLT